MLFRTYVRLWKTWKGQNEVPWVIKTAANVHRGCFSIYIADYWVTSFCNGMSLRKLLHFANNKKFSIERNAILKTLRKIFRGHVQEVLYLKAKDIQCHLFEDNKKKAGQWSVFADFIVKFEQILRILMVSSEAATGGGLYKKVFFKKFVKFTGKHLCQRPLFNKVADWKKYVKFRKQNTASSHIYPFYVTVLFLYPVKASANQSFSDAFREYRERTVA